MKIIDAHMHFSKAIPSFAPMAERVGHLYTEEHLQAEFARLNIERCRCHGQRQHSSGMPSVSGLSALLHWIGQQSDGSPAGRTRS